MVLTLSLFVLCMDLRTDSNF